MMTRQEVAEGIQAAYNEKCANPACYVSEVTEVAPDDETGFATFSVHLGGLDGDIFHVHVYKE